MAVTVDATYQNGVLKLDQPLPLRESQRVQVTIEPKKNWGDETYGILGWKGSVEDLRQLALERESDIEAEA